jgi:hypothetical protein
VYQRRDMSPRRDAKDSIEQCNERLGISRMTGTNAGALTAGE